MKIEKLVFVGHSAVFLKTSIGTIAIDPWLEGNPSCPDELKNPDDLKLIVLTHGHADHASDTTRLAKHYGCEIIATWELANLLISEGVPQDNVIHMNKGGSYNWNGATVSLVDAKHSSSYDTADGPQYAGEACGVVISANKTIYHAGDTSLFEGMTYLGENFKPDVALLPCGDRFTMGPKDAALAAKMIGAGVTVPIHWGTFDLLTGSADQFSECCRENGVESQVLQSGGAISF